MGSSPTTFYSSTRIFPQRKSLEILGLAEMTGAVFYQPFALTGASLDALVHFHRPEKRWPPLAWGFWDAAGEGQHFPELCAVSGRL